MANVVDTIREGLEAIAKGRAILEKVTGDIAQGRAAGGIASLQEAKKILAEENQQTRSAAALLNSAIEQQLRNTGD